MSKIMLVYRVLGTWPMVPGFQNVLSSSQDTHHAGLAGAMF